MEICRDWIVLSRLGWRIFVNKLREFRLWPYETVVRSTNIGLVKGTKRKTVYNISYYSFEGIPFAKPPLGKLRFRAPEPPEPWKGVLDCTKAKLKPKQKHLVFNLIEGSEDCLYLNVYAKQLEATKKYPVIVYVHGGGFQAGEAGRETFGPDYFMEYEIVFVCITYRLGAFGFLSFDDPKLNIPGNAGLKDQILALEWVKHNIHHFNGDSRNITVIGQSAGASSVHIIMCCERAKGLFHKAILMSGSALCSWATFPQRDWEYRLAQRLGYKGSNIDTDVFSFLETADANEITRVHSFLMNKQDRKDKLNAPFGPTIESYTTEHSVLTQPILKLLKNAWGNQIPMILGGTSNESMLLYANAMQFPYLVNELHDCETLVPPDVQEHNTPEEIKEMGLKLKKFYFNNEDPNIRKHMSEYLDLINYSYFWHGFHRTIRGRLAHAPDVPTYLYRFNFDSPIYNYLRMLWCGRALSGVIHCSELALLFYNIYSKKFPVTSTEYKLMRTLFGIITNFAKLSNPNCEEIRPNIWKPVENSKNERLMCLNIGEKCSVIELPESKKIPIWDSFYTKCPLY